MVQCSVTMSSKPVLRSDKNSFFKRNIVTCQQCYRLQIHHPPAFVKNALLFNYFHWLKISLELLRFCVEDRSGLNREKQRGFFLAKRKVAPSTRKFIETIFFVALRKLDTTNYVSKRSDFPVFPFIEEEIIENSDFQIRFEKKFFFYWKISTNQIRDLEN